jgi:hypothetical protein
MVSLFVACLSVFILIQRGFKENGSCQKKKQIAGSVVLDPLINTNIAEIQAKVVVFSTIDNIEFVDWTSINKFTCLLF